MPAFDRIWSTVLNKNNSNSGSDDRPVLIVNVDGTDVVHDNMLPGYVGSGLGTGAAALAKIPLNNGGLLSEALNNSSVRAGIRGDDRWRPDLIFIWGDRQNEGGQDVTPLAIETEIATGVSTDRSEGVTSLPLRLVARGADDMTINRLLLVMETSPAGRDPETNDHITLQISAGGVLLVNFTIPDTPQEDQEAGYTNIYFAPIGPTFSKSRIDDRSIILSTDGTDAWRPSSFFLFGLDTDEGRPNVIVPLVSIPDWSFPDLSTDLSEGQPFVTLPLV